MKALAHAMQEMGPSYLTLHKRVYRARGRAKDQQCPCGKPAIEWSNRTGEYGNVLDYDALCKRCHVERDLGAWDKETGFCPKGHDVTIKGRTRGECNQCRVDRTREWKRGRRESVS